MLKYYNEDWIVMILIQINTDSDDTHALDSDDTLDRLDSNDTHTK